MHKMMVISNLLVIPNFHAMRKNIGKHINLHTNANCK